MKWYIIIKIGGNIFIKIILKFIFDFSTGPTVWTKRSAVSLPAE